VRLVWFQRFVGSDRQCRLVGLECSLSWIGVLWKLSRRPCSGPCNRRRLVLRPLSPACAGPPHPETPPTRTRVAKEGRDTSRAEDDEFRVFAVRQQQRLKRRESAHPARRACSLSEQPRPQHIPRRCGRRDALFHERQGVTETRQDTTARARAPAALCRGAARPRRPRSWTPTLQSPPRAHYS
jgi:hypothetical protein